MNRDIVEKLLEALKLADSALSGAHMNMNLVQRKVHAAIAVAERELNKPIDMGR